MMASTSNGGRPPIRSDHGGLNSTGVSEARRTCTSRFPQTLSDSVLLQICRVPDDDPQVSREWLIKLRIVPLLVGGPQNARLEPAMTCLASVLGLLTQFNPTHLPFGYTGPRMHSRGWVDRDALERVGKQIVGMIRPQTSPETVASTVQHAVSESVRLGFLEERQYDAWRPGMPSGSGWRSAVATTPYGLTRACRVDDGYSDSDGAAMDSAVMAAPRAATEAAPAEPTPQGTNAIEDPVVQLGRPGEPCFVLGQQKQPTTDGEYAIVSALIRAGDEGMAKDALEAIRPSARRILRALREDADWAAVILMPGRTNGRYRIRTSTSAHV